MKYLMIIPLLLSSMLSLPARLGETEANIETRYGEGKADPKDKTVRWYKAENFVIRVDYGDEGEMRGGRSVTGLSIEEQYCPRERRFSERAIRAILDANKGTSEWSTAQVFTGLSLAPLPPGVPQVFGYDTECIRYWTNSDNTRYASLCSRVGRAQEILTVEWTALARLPDRF